MPLGSYRGWGVPPAPRPVSRPLNMQTSPGRPAGASNASGIANAARAVQVAQALANAQRAATAAQALGNAQRVSTAAQAVGTALGANRSGGGSSYSGGGSSGGGGGTTTPTVPTPTPPTPPVPPTPPPPPTVAGPGAQNTTGKTFTKTGNPGTYGGFQRERQNRGPRSSLSVTPEMLQRIAKQRIVNRS